MTTEEIRIECLRLAIERNKGNFSDDVTLASAELFAKFVTAKPKGRPRKQ